MTMVQAPKRTKPLDERVEDAADQAMSLALDLTALLRELREPSVAAEGGNDVHSPVGDDVDERTEGP